MCSPQFCCFTFLFKVSAADEATFVTGIDVCELRKPVGNFVAQQPPTNPPPPFADAFRRNSFDKLLSWYHYSKIETLLSCGLDLASLLGIWFRGDVSGLSTVRLAARFPLVLNVPVFSPAVAPDFSQNLLKTHTLVRETGDVLIECRPKMSPRGMISWRKGNEALRDSKRYTVLSQINQFTLDMIFIVLLLSWLDDFASSRGRSASEEWSKRSGSTLHFKNYDNVFVSRSCARQYICVTLFLLLERNAFSVHIYQKVQWRRVDFLIFFWPDSLTYFLHLLLVFSMRAAADVGSPYQAVHKSPWVDRVEMSPSRAPWCKNQRLPPGTVWVLIKHFAASLGVLSLLSCTLLGTICFYHFTFERESVRSGQTFHLSGQACRRRAAGSILMPGVTDPGIGHSPSFCSLRVLVTAVLCDSENWATLFHEQTPSFWQRLWGDLHRGYAAGPLQMLFLEKSLVLRV